MYEQINSKFEFQKAKFPRTNGYLVRVKMLEEKN